MTSPEGSFGVEVDHVADGFHVRVGGSVYFLKLKRGTGRDQFVVEVADKPVSVTLLEASQLRVDLILDGERISFQRPAPAVGRTVPPFPPVPATKDLITAPMPGKVVGILVKEGEEVEAGDPLVILESMKMEIAVRSDRSADVEEILVVEGAPVKRGQGLVRLGQGPS